MEGTIRKVGWLIIAVGIGVGIYLALSMKIYEPGLAEGYFYENPHPLRWVYGFACALSASFFGFVLIGISEIINRLDSSNTQTNHNLRSIIETTKRNASV